MEQKYFFVINMVNAA